MNECYVTGLSMLLEGSRVKLEGCLLGRIAMVYDSIMLLEVLHDPEYDIGHGCTFLSQPVTLSSSQPSSSLAYGCDRVTILGNSDRGTVSITLHYHSNGSMA